MMNQSVNKAGTEAFQSDPIPELQAVKRIKRNPRVLMVTPEVSYLPQGMGEIAPYLAVKAGGLADVSATLISALFDEGADIHVAIPDYRQLYNRRLPPQLKRSIQTVIKTIPNHRIHLAEDRSFFHLNHVYEDGGWHNTKCAIAFQREVINNIIPRVQPDLIHCHDWMTGLLPAMARKINIPCLFTIHNIHTAYCSLAVIEDFGIDTSEFWENLYFRWSPGTYEQIRDSNPVDFLASGIFGAHYVNTVSHSFLMEMTEGRHEFVPYHIRWELNNKTAADCAYGVLNAPDPSFDPASDPCLEVNYHSKNHTEGKASNKRILQQRLKLAPDIEAPLFFWPSRLDPFQKGCQLLAEILFEVISTKGGQSPQVIFVSDGPYQQHFKEFVRYYKIQESVAVCDYSDELSRWGYAASDFVLMPSRFEPCGLTQMIGMIYGALPIAHDTGGIHDTVQHLDLDRNTGNGFLFEVFDAQGLGWAIQESMKFYGLSREIKRQTIERVMTQSRSLFRHELTVRSYIQLYEKMLRRPLFSRN